MTDTKFICMDGRDRIGKETQVQMLWKHLKDKGHSVIKFRFPRYEDKYGRLMRGFLKGEEDLPVVVYESLNWVDQREWEKAWVDKLTGNVDYVILDRFWPSMEAYSLAQGMREEVVYEMVDKLFKPHITLIMYGEPWSCERKSDMWERDESLTEAVNVIMKVKAETRENWSVINARHSKERVHGSILEVLKKENIL